MLRKTSCTELLGKVSRLVECLEQSNELSGRGGIQAHWEVADSAIRAALTMEQMLSRQLQRIAHLETLAITDELTTLLNRRGFLAALNRALASARRYGEEGVLVYIDLDGFKPINDTFGHAAGDEVLRTVARILSGNIRDTDVIGRLGGDEFAVLLTRSDWQNGVKRAETINHLLNNSCAEFDGRRIALKASIGLKPYGAADDGEDLLRSADQAMYKTKRLRADLCDEKISA